MAVEAAGERPTAFVDGSNRIASELFGGTALHRIVQTPRVKPVSTPETRSYRSAVRQQQASGTRLRILTAASDLFAARGWIGTGMREIAAGAGVSVETVYKHFSSKSELLVRLLDVAAVADDEPVPLAERPEFVALGAGSFVDRTAAAARLMTGINTRFAPLVPALREAASSEPKLAEALTDLYGRQRREVARGGSLVAGRALTDAENDGLWAILSVDAFILLTRYAGWTEQDYQGWAATTVATLLIPSHPRTGRATLRPPKGGRP